ncbi:hypothetical protein [Methylocystis parvus]|uniref:Uncharacterized protein n=1 Tax=Methylocystis parvus TaxID=134 RepID=A0A6B8M252_9HYPH|nr:hypothetical protein [Methylocystis parvus]QGM98927.1 hypothetical protein F7D14_16500 [Methylocystis parvus]WBK00718.1 hypothetical protein MMG94_03035 [Methylocystis parvus OBBP]
MHFIIDIDSGDTISGWLAPDNPSSVPLFIVSIPGREDIELRANVLREGIRDLGLHATGECGFAISTDLIPDLPNIRDLEIVEAATRLPIYRRFQADLDVARKIFLFDCSVIPQRRIVNEIKNRFSLAYMNSERNGLETTVAIIANPYNQSIFISGRSVLMRYNDLLKEKGYVRAALLREPHEELAERLYFFNFLVREGDAESFAQYTTGARNLLEFARDLPFNDVKALTSAFRASTEQQRRELMSPMTKVFGCDVDEPPKHANVSKALDSLADFEVVGTRERFALFKDLLAGAVGVNILGDEEPVVFQSVKTLASNLAKIGIVNDLLADDLALYSFAEDAINEGLTNPEGMMQREI